MHYSTIFPHTFCFNQLLSRKCSTSRQIQTKQKTHSKSNVPDEVRDLCHLWPISVPPLANLCATSGQSLWQHLARVVSNSSCQNGSPDGFLNRFSTMCNQEMWNAHNAVHKLWPLCYICKLWPLCWRMKYRVQSSVLLVKILMIHFLLLCRPSLRSGLFISSICFMMLALVAFTPQILSIGNTAIRFWAVLREKTALKKCFKSNCNFH